MLEIVRGRNWIVAHTVLEGENGPPTVLSQFSSIYCQIREKLATRNKQGFFEHKLVATPTVSRSGSVYYLKLDVDDVSLLQTGEYLIDVVAQNPDGSSESLLDPEPVRVTNRPSQPIVVVVEPPPPPPPQSSSPGDSLGQTPPVDTAPAPTAGPGAGTFTTVTYATLPLGVLEFTIDGSVESHGSHARFSFWHSGDTDKRANGVCYTVDGGTATFVRGGYRPTSTSDLDLVSKMLPVPWFPSGVAMEAMFQVTRTPGTDQVVRVWAANLVSTPQATPTTQITAFTVSCGKWKALNLKYATALVEAAFSGGVHASLDIAGAFTTAGRLGLKSLIVDLADAAGELTFSMFPGLRRLVVTGNSAITSIRAVGLALQVIPSEQRLTSPSMFFNCTLGGTELDRLYTDLSAVPNNGQLLISTGTGGSTETIATNKGYTIFDSIAEMNDYINTH